MGFAYEEPDTSGETNDSSGSTTTTYTTTDTSTSSGSTSEWEDSRDNKLAAVIDLETSGSGNFDEQVQGGTTADQILGDVQTNPDVTQELVTMTATGDAQNSVPENSTAPTTETQAGDIPLLWIGVAAVAVLIGLGGS